VGYDNKIQISRLPLVGPGWRAGCIDDINSRYQMELPLSFFKIDALSDNGRLCKKLHLA